MMERHHIWIADSGQRTGLMRYAFVQYPASHRVLGRATERLPVRAVQDEGEEEQQARGDEADAGAGG
ncbi:hypothetical protein ACWCRC_42990, partial [Streptomyces sp. NPDC001940]